SKRDIIYCMQKAYDSVKLDFDASKLLIGPPLEKIVNILSPDISPMLHAKVIENFRFFYMHTDFQRTFLYEGVRETLEFLKKEGLRLFIATNKPKKATSKVLQHFQLDSLFEFVGTPDGLQEGILLSKTAVMAHILQKFQLNAKQTIMVGDTPPDILAAKENQVAGIAFLGGYGKQEDLERSGARFCIKYFKELLELLS
ncbi:MAG: HAD hydrolase-like protein, partial [Bacteroidales bacterium]